MWMFYTYTCININKVFPGGTVGKESTCLCPWNSPGSNSGVGSHSFLQGIFWTPGLNPALLHCRQMLCIEATREASEIL